MKTQREGQVLNGIFRHLTVLPIIEISGTPTKVHQQGTALETTFRWNLGWRAIQLQFQFNNSRVCCVRRFQEIKLWGFNYTKDQDKGALLAESWEQSSGVNIMLGGIIFLKRI